MSTLMGPLTVIKQIIEHDKVFTTTSLPLLVVLKMKI